METRTDHGLGARLREALEPGPDAVERIVRGALAPRPPARPSRLVPAVAGMAAVAALLALFLVRPRAEREAAVSIENVGDVMIVRPHEGGRWVIHNGEHGAGSSPSGSVIVIHGDQR
jgi:hypothetical protein